MLQLMKNSAPPRQLPEHLMMQKDPKRNNGSLAMGGKSTYVALLSSLPLCSSSFTDVTHMSTCLSCSMSISSLGEEVSGRDLFAVIHGGSEGQSVQDSGIIGVDIGWYVIISPLLGMQSIWCTCRWPE